MGQHKHNPTAIAAKNGELPPKPKKMGKRESERLMSAKCQEILYRPLVQAMVRYNGAVLPDLPKGENNHD